MTHTPAAARGTYLERLVINVTHDCNMRCAYCFADAGAYGSERGMLSETTGRRIIEDFFSRFERIGRIQFFGGEPFLNCRSIEALCGATVERCERQGVTPPAFTVITNGTILNESIIEMIKKYQISVTVSLDGPEALNDSYRVFVGGTGSFKRVVNNVKILKTHTGQPFQVEGTFTSRHLERRFSLAEFLRFLARELGVHFLHMPWILGNGYNAAGILPTEENLERLLAVYAEAITGSFHSLRDPAMSETAVISIVERFVDRCRSGAERTPQRYYCPAGSGTLSVGMDGKVYPCFMFTNVPAFELTHVEALDKGELTRNRAAFVKQIERPDDEGTPGEVISSCAGMNYETHGRITGISSAEKRVWERLNAHLNDEADAYRRQPETWEWMQTKFLLHRLEMLGVLDSSAACG